MQFIALLVPPGHPKQAVPCRIARDRFKFLLIEFGSRPKTEFFVDTLTTQQAKTPTSEGCPWIVKQTVSLLALPFPPAAFTWWHTPHIASPLRWPCSKARSFPNAGAALKLSVSACCGFFAG